MGDVSDVDEFSFLPAQAADAGLDVSPPRAERIAMTLTDGRVLSAVRYGEGPPAVVFLHGVGLNAHTWDTTILALDLPSLAIDLAGHGDSDWRNDAAYTPRILAPDVVAALSVWTEQPTVLVGQSLGGLTAAAVAASAPDAVRKLVVVDITPGVDPSAGPAALREFFAPPTDWASREELVDRAMAFGLGGGSREKVARGVFLNSRVREDGRVEWKHHFAHLAAAAHSGESARGAAPLTALLAESGWDDFAAVSAPLTLIRGRRGYVTEADASEFTRRLHDAKLVEVDSGHNVQEEAPVELARLIAAAI